MNRRRVPYLRPRMPRHQAGEFQGLALSDGVHSLRVPLLFDVTGMPWVYNADGRGCCGERAQSVLSFRSLLRRTTDGVFIKMLSHLKQSFSWQHFYYTPQRTLNKGGCWGKIKNEWHIFYFLMVLVYQRRCRGKRPSLPNTDLLFLLDEWKHVVLFFFLHWGSTDFFQNTTHVSESAAERYGTRWTRNVFINLLFKINVYFNFNLSSVVCVNANHWPE